MSRGLTFGVGGFYHVYNRGTEKRNIFSSTKDYERFLSLLYLSNSSNSLHLNNYRHRGSTSVALREALERERLDPLTDICAYVLMPNHFHLLLHERNENGISRFMQKLLTGYTMYFNTRYERTGALFQGKFKAQDANEDRYLKYLISYIHLNPVKLIEPNWKEDGIHNHKRVKLFLDDYRFSSYSDYRGRKRLEGRILNPNALPGYFEIPKELDQHIADWLKYTEVRPR